MTVGGPPAPGWYPDPAGSGGQRWWNGNEWTDHQQGAPQQGAAPQAAPFPAMSGGAAGMIPQPSRNWAMLAHLSGLIGLFSGVFGFLGPLVIYLVKTDDPYVRREAAEALNFNLSVLLYGVIFGLITIVALIAIVGVILLPFWILGAIAWVALMVVGGVKASRGEPYRYPLTIRFVSP